MKADGAIEALDLAVPRSKGPSAGSRRDQRPVDLWGIFSAWTFAANGGPGQGTSSAGRTEAQPSTADKGLVDTKGPVNGSVQGTLGGQTEEQPSKDKGSPVVGTKRLENGSVQGISGGQTEGQPSTDEGSSSALAAAEELPPTVPMRRVRRRPVGMVLLDDDYEDLRRQPPSRSQSEDAAMLLDHNAQAVVPSSRMPLGRNTLWRRSKKFARNCVSRAARKMGIGGSDDSNKPRQ